MILPTVHLNGTSREDLLDGYTEALAALHTAISKLAATSPNGRDYYPQGDFVINRAIEEHVARLAKLQAVVGEIETIAIAVGDAA